MRRTHTLVTISLAALLWGCAEDPIYLDPPDAVIEFDPTVMDPAPDAFTVTVDLPIRIERDTEAEDRAELAADLGIEVPYVNRDALEISIEWTLTNLDDAGEVRAQIDVNGANEYFRYVPAAFVIDPQEDEEPPALLEGIPFDVPASGVQSGVIREDQVREASLDLELFTRGSDPNPFGPILRVDEDTTEFVTPGGQTVPKNAIASLVRFEVSLTANRACRLEFDIRVRDNRGIVHDELYSAPGGELTVFAPADFAPPAAMP